VAHQGDRLANSDEERLRLRIERRIPLLQADVQGRLEKRRDLRPCVADEDVELPELRSHLAKHPGQLFRARHVGLDHDAIGTALADLGKRLAGGALVLIVMDRDLDSVLSQLQRNSSTDASRASSDERVFPIERHTTLPT
jgi:hypothetical protein